MECVTQTDIFSQMDRCRNELTLEDTLDQETKPIKRPDRYSVQNYYNK